VAAGKIVDQVVEPGRWQADFDLVMGRVAGRFARVEPRRRAAAFVMGLLARLPRSNCWTVAEHAGDASPHGMQHLLARAVWDAEAVRDDVRGYLVEHLADDEAGAEAVLVVDETGDLKKGSRTVGVQRQYTGTAGRIENSQVSVWLTYATPAGHGLIDRALYLPRCWVEDPARRASAGVPDEVGFAAKPQLARQMIARTLDAGVRAGWLIGDETSTAPTRACAPNANGAGSATCWPSPAATMSPPPPGRCAPTPCRCGYRRGPGSRSRPAPAPKATEFTTGH
jgi:SRSO17 transposase